MEVDAGGAANAATRYVGFWKWSCGWILPLSRPRTVAPAGNGLARPNSLLGSAWALASTARVVVRFKLR